MAQHVYFLNVTEHTSFEEISKGLKKIAAAEEMQPVFSGKLTALKMHFGECDSPKTVSPEFVKAIADEVKQNGGKPFLTDTNTLYTGNRANAVDHLTAAFRHGYSVENVGAPVIILDGLTGRNFTEVTIDLKHCKTAKIPKDILSIDSLIGITHITGHGGTGLGGSIKNIGMGLASRGGKQIQHSGILPSINENECTACGECAAWCPVNAITVKTKAVIDPRACIGCGECTVTCEYNAIAVRWDESSVNLQEKLAEYTYAVINNIKGKSCFFNVLIEVTRGCDCIRREQDTHFASLGILASTDIVAVDQAAFDLMKKHEGCDVIEKWYGISGLYQLEHGEAIGLGSRSYELEEITV